MSNNKQSSVEWLMGKLGKYNEEMIFLYENEIQAAKAMHKEEIKEAWDNAAIDATYGNKFKNFEQYYNETYGGNNDKKQNS